MSNHPLGPAAGSSAGAASQPWYQGAPLHITKVISAAIPISEQEHRDRTVGPTETERAEQARRHAEQLNRESSERELYTVRRESATGWLRQVFDLHAPNCLHGSWFQCGSCYDGGNMGDHEDWPCPTARILLGQP
jgi:hypothetical protein